MKSIPVVSTERRWYSVYSLITKHLSPVQRSEQWEVTSENILTVIQEITSIRDRLRDELSGTSVNIHEDKMF